MHKIFENSEGNDPLQATREFRNQFLNYIYNVQQMMSDYEQLQSRVKTMEKEIEQLKKGDEWSSRVTYEGVVEQIAACEDAKERDEARKLIEPLLKREMAAKFRRDIRRRAKELNEGGSNILIQQAEVRVQSPGNNIAHTIYYKE